MSKKTVMLINKTSGEAVKLGEPGYLAPGMDAKAYCCLKAPVRPWYSCTRALGHGGDHAAHGGPGTMFARWRAE